ncbi:MAG: hypothetical protein R3C28_26245 [Pirellulaceae bacterium]
MDSWVDDIYMWRAEHKQAMAWLSQIEATLRQADTRLERHRSSIDSQVRHIQQHEHEIVLQQQRDRTDDSTELAEQHADFLSKQDKLRMAHANLGDDHRTRQTRIRQLVR